MKRKLSFLVIASVLILGACQNNNKDKQHLITKESIGNLTKDTKVNQLDSVFDQDSVVFDNESGSFSTGNKIIVYKKGGDELLRLQPLKNFDSTSTIGSVRIMDTIFKTEEGFGLRSDFKILESNYNVSRIENTLGTAMIFVNEMNFYVDVDKKDIVDPTEMGAKIKTSQIKDNAKIKRMWLDWE